MNAPGSERDAVRAATWKTFDRDLLIRLFVLLAAAVFFFWGLPLKPPHADEGVNGFFVNQISNNGYFRYNPSNFHGPLLFYLFLISEKIFGFGVSSFRIVTVSFSLLTLGLFPGVRPVYGKRPGLFIAILLAASPAVAFFGRSAIHESPFVFFQVLWITGFLLMKEGPGRVAPAFFIVGLLGCVLLKETFVILGLSLLVGWSWLMISGRLLPAFGVDAEPAPRTKLGTDRVFMLEAVTIALIVWFLFYTGFLHNFGGARDFFVALAPWLKTGMGGSGHDKPFLYWLQLLWRYEWPVLAGVALAIPGLLGRSWKMRFMSALGLTNLLVYSLIPYKTPWCIISMIWPFAVIAGWRLDSAFGLLRGRNMAWSFVLAAFAAFLIGRSAAVSYRLNFIRYTDPSEPYVYVQTKNDIRVLENVIRKKIVRTPSFQKDMRARIYLGSSWPLPWLFSPYPEASYARVGDRLDRSADIIITEASRNGAELKGRYLRRRMELRDGRGPICVYLKKETFVGIDLPGFTEVQD